MNLLIGIFFSSVIAISAPPPHSFFSVFQSALLPTDISSTPLSHMSVLLGVELQIPIDVGELSLHPLSQSTLNSMFFSLLATVHSNIPKMLLFYTHCMHIWFILYVWNGDKVMA